jgi:hypothetical protein
VPIVWNSGFQNDCQKTNTRRYGTWKVPTTLCELTGWEDRMTDRLAGRELIDSVYNELRRLAGRQLAAEQPGQTLNPTALVHEAYLRLVGENDQAK